MEDDSEEVAFSISSTNPEAKRFEIYQARTVSNMELPHYSLDVSKVAKRWPFVEKAVVNNLQDAVPRVLLGQDNWPLLQTRKSFSGPWNGPIVSLTWLGWVIHGNISQVAPSQPQASLQLSHWNDAAMKNEERIEEESKGEIMSTEQEKLEVDEARDGKEEFRKEAPSRDVAKEGEAKKGDAESEAKDEVKKEDVEGVDKEEASDVSCDKNEDEEQLMTGEDDLVEKQKYVNTKRRGRGNYKLDMWKNDARSITLDNSTDPKGKTSNLRLSKLVTITLAQDLKRISSKLGKVAAAKMVTNAKTLGAQSSTSPSSTEGSSLSKTEANCSKEKRLQLDEDDSRSKDGTSDKNENRKNKKQKKTGRRAKKKENIV
ncbi:hypothetical protein GE061_019603 [Apolygus lucorum]|uniref:Uncharacterized protein n=1 Tax=Apolygus lucorum TaxID=248454 RepID=A0A8S9XAU7_APOLU|nr:hypothetical protein GE061_019603 [Apolygus lucorum]